MRSARATPGHRGGRTGGQYLTADPLDRELCADLTLAAGAALARRAGNRFEHSTFDKIKEIY